MADTLRSDLARVLVLAMDHHLGNTVVTLPVIAAFAKYFQSGIDVVTDTRYACLARRVGGVNRVWRYPAQRTDGKKAKGKNVQDEALFYARLNLRRYDAVIDATGGIRATTVAATLAMRGVRRRVGFSDGRRAWVYSQRVVPPDIKTTHVKERYAALLQSVGRSEYPEDFRLTPSATGLAEADEVLRKVFGVDVVEASETRPIVVMHPAAGIPWRQWPAERFAAVAARLVEEAHARVAIIGTPADRELAEGVRAASGHSGDVAFTPMSLDGLLGLYTRSAAIVSNESGPTHLAALTELPIVTIFGPTPEVQWRPVRASACSVLRGAACDPGCHGRTCAVDLRCLTELTAEEVAESTIRAIRGAAIPMPA